jgi:hypothetical protein
MKRIFGAVLLVAGAVCLYFFVSRGMFHGRGMMGSTFDPGLPFRSMGKDDYPANALLLLGAGWGLILGLWFVILGDPPREGAPTRGGGIARLMLLNALLLASSLLAGFVGGKSGADVATVAVFGTVALLQILLGLILLVLALFERPKGWVSLGLGFLVYGAGAAAGLLTFLAWGAGA